MTSPRRREPQTDARVWEWLYALVAAGMWAFSTARFEVEVAGGGFPTVTSGQLWVSTHRAETDVPLLAGLMYARGGMWRRWTS